MGNLDIFSLGKKIRSVEKNITKGLIKWRIKRASMPPPDEETLDRGSEHIVNEAHRVVKKVVSVSLKS